MPLIDVEKVGRIVIAERGLQDHLTKSEEKRARLNFQEYIRNFGIFDLGELTENQLFSLVAARNIAPVIDLLRIPIGKEISDHDALSSYDQNRPKTSLGPAMNKYLSQSPTLESECDILRDPEDIPEAVPEDLLLRRLAPKEFLRRLTEGELLKSTWINETEDHLLDQEVVKFDQNIEQSSAAPEDTRPFGYILLDASESMGSSRDRRDEIARGLALAFLLNQFQSGNPCIVYLFRNDLSLPVGGEDRHDFEHAAATILRHEHLGMTNLQGTLAEMSKQLTAKHARVDIALITDGITRLNENPLGPTHLHTFLLGATPEELDKQGEAQYKDSILKLDYWSNFLIKFDQAEMKWVSIPDQQDISGLTPLLHGFEQEIANAASADKVRQLQRRLHNIKLLTNRYSGLTEQLTLTEKELIFRLDELIEKYGTKSADRISIENAIQWTKVDRGLLLNLETRELSGVLTQKIDPSGFILYGQASSYQNIWVLLIQFIKVVLRIKSKQTFE